MPEHSSLPWRIDDNNKTWDANGESLNKNPSLQVANNKLAIASANACQGINPGAVQEMYSTLENAQTSLAIAQMDRLDDTVASNREIIDIVLKSISAALALAKPDRKVEDET